MENTHIHLERDFGINFQNGSKTLAEVLPSITDAQNKFKDLFGWARAKGWSDSEIMGLYYGEAGWHNALWLGENGNYNSPAPGHAWNIGVGAGRYKNKSCMPVAQGEYYGAGSRPHDGNNVHSYGGTTFEIDHANWMWSRYPEQFNIRSVNWGIDSGDSGWTHHTKINRFAFEGAKRTPYYTEDGKMQGAIGIWDTGEVSIIEKCFFQNHEKDGIVFARGTPATVKVCSFFGQNRFGVGIHGGGNISMDRCSGDEHGLAMVGGRPGYGRPCASQLTMIATKQETGTSPQFQPFKGSALIDFEGWLDATIHGVTYAATWVVPYTLIRILPNVNRSSITATGLQYFSNAPKCLVYDEGENKEYVFAGNAFFNDHDNFHWKQGQGIKSQFNVPASNQRTGVKGRLTHLGQGGAESWETSPIWTGTGTGGVVNPPTEATWVVGPWSEWSECVNGRQSRTRTVTSSIPGQIPAGTKPTGIEAQDCTVTPPPTGAVIASFNFSAVNTETITAQVGTEMKQIDGAKRVSNMAGGKITNTRGAASYPVVWDGATSITLKFKPSVMNYQLLCGLTDTDGNGRGIMLKPNGSVIDNTLAGGDRELKPAGTFQVGREDTVTINFGAMNIRFFGSNGAQGNAWQGVMDQFEVK